jgi:hypothetical protein
MAKKTEEPKIKQYTIKELRDMPQKVPKVNWTWVEVRKDLQWVTSEIPDGEVSTPRVAQSSKRYACYRNSVFLGMELTLEKAKVRCAIGEPNELEKRVREWEKDHKGEFPPFLKMTEQERASWRAHYPEMTAATFRGFGKPGEGDPEARQRKAEMLGGVKGVAKARAKAAESGVVLTGKITRAKQGNPKKAGTDAHGRWETLFKFDGKTVEQFLDNGGNPTTLKNAVAQGYVKVEA